MAASSAAQLLEPPEQAMSIWPGAGVGGAVAAGGVVVGDTGGCDGEGDGTP